MKLNLRVASVAAGLLGHVFAQHADRQIAIIGAGAAGTSAAYFLRQFASEAGVNVNITLFERTDRIGGRTRTINVFDDPSQPFEQGASIFVQINHVLYDSMIKFGLTPRDPDVSSDPLFGIWDGDKFVLAIDANAPSWWNSLKVLFRYGLSAPKRTRELRLDTIGRFLRIYTPDFFPFKSLTERAEQLNLTEATGVTGQQYLKAHGIGGLFASEFIQSFTRVNYASNLARLNGLVTMVSLSTDGAIAVQGGNWQIFDEMARRSGAHIALDTAVVELSKEGSKYSVKTTSGRSKTAPKSYDASFDNVIIANPFQFSGISPGLGVLSTKIEPVDYVRLHVTIFTSPKSYSPAFFKLSDSSRVPGVVMTTLNESDSPTSGPDGVGKPGFFSISILGKATNPKTQEREYVYKIFSPETVTPEFLSKLFGEPVPSTFTGDSSPISWYKATVFHSYPKITPRTTFQDPIIGPGVYYTGGMEAFISTMETSALMGKNIARLIVDDILTERGKMGNPEDSERENWFEDEKQAVLNRLDVGGNMGLYFDS